MFSFSKYCLTLSMIISKPFSAIQFESNPLYSYISLFPCSIASTFWKCLSSSSHSMWMCPILFLVSSSVSLLLFSAWYGFEAIKIGSLLYLVQYSIFSCPSAALCQSKVLIVPWIDKVQCISQPLCTVRAIVQGTIALLYLATSLSSCDANFSNRF